MTRRRSNLILDSWDEVLEDAHDFKQVTYSKPSSPGPPAASPAASSAASPAASPGNFDCDEDFQLAIALSLSISAQQQPPSPKATDSEHNSLAIAPENLADFPVLAPSKNRLARVAQLPTPGKVSEDDWELVHAITDDATSVCSDVSHMSWEVTPAWGVRSFAELAKSIQASDSEQQMSTSDTRSKTRVRHTMTTATIPEHSEDITMQDLALQQADLKGSIAQSRRRERRYDTWGRGKARYKPFKR